MTRWTDDLASRCRSLSTVPYFASLAPADLRELATAARVVRRRRGQVLFQEGQECTGLHVLAEGRVRILKLSPSGRVQVLHVEDRGAIGEAPLIDGEPYPATAEAVAPTVVLFLPKAVVLDWCRRRGELALGMATVLARRVRRFASLAESLALHQVGTRLAAYLVDRMEVDGTTFRLGESNQEIAARLGTVRELVSRLLGELRREGLIEVTGRTVTVLDTERLRRRAAP